MRVRQSDGAVHLATPSGRGRGEQQAKRVRERGRDQPGRVSFAPYEAARGSLSLLRPQVLPGGTHPGPLAPESSIRAAPRERRIRGARTASPTGRKAPAASPAFRS